MLFGMTFTAEPATAQTAPAKSDAPATETTLPNVEVKEGYEREQKGYQGGTTSIGKTPLRREEVDAAPLVQLTNCYHNLLRIWADV